MDCYGGYEMIQSPRVTESERPVSWHGIGTPEDARLGCRLQPLSPLSYSPHTCSYPRPQKTETHYALRKALLSPCSDDEHITTIDDLAPGEASFCFSTAGADSCGPSHTDEFSNEPWAFDTPCVTPFRPSVARCKNEAWSTDDEGEELYSWELGSEDDEYPGSQGTHPADPPSHHVLDNDSSDELGEEEEFLGCVTVSEVMDSMTRCETNQNGIEGQQAQVQILKAVNSHWPVHPPSAPQNGPFVSLLQSASPLSYCNVAQPSLNGDAGSLTYTRRILSAFHQVSYELGLP